MESSLTSFPDTKALAAGLGCIFRPHELPAREIHILRREANPYSRKFPSEVVAYRREDGSEMELFCKYMYYPSADLEDPRSRGVEYEAKVYDQILRSLRMTIPTYHGTYNDPVTGAVWLILQHLDNSVELQRAPEAAVQQAATWIGRFHAAQEKRLAGTPLLFLTNYDADFYQGWARRTAEFAGPWQRRIPWLLRLCERFEPVINILLTAAPTIIHGDYYPMNILFHDGAIYPVDWESAAVAPGEIDLVFLTEGWPADVVSECECAYRQARWPDGTPAGFDKLMAGARFFRSLRALGEQPDWPDDEDTFYQLEELARAGRFLGLVKADSLNEVAKI